jgi:hypothetical protein
MGIRNVCTSERLKIGTSANPELLFGTRRGQRGRGIRPMLELGKHGRE